jgi:hypothetical protein
MRAFMIASLLVGLVGGSVAHADDGEYHAPAGYGYHDGGMDHGAIAALTGGIVLSIVDTATAISANVGDSLCSLNYDNPSCNTGAHSRLEIPLVGGFLYGGSDKALPILSSVVQIGATGLLIGGLAVHKWQVKDRPTVARR